METNTIGDGRYEMSGLLGRGGMAEVRKGRDLRLGRPVAIKRLRADLASDPTFQARFRREAQSAASLNHPVVVAVYDTGDEPAPDGSGLMLPYIVMEYVEGRTLRDVLREGRKILPERALEITGSVLDALDYSHRAGIVHRDIKPANVMLTPTGDVKVMDFGIARAIADSSATMTQTAAVIGTAQYLSPEQARGEQVDARSDLYSAGCLLYELLTGRPPFVGDSPVSVAYQHVREEPQPPSVHNREITPTLDAITMKALSKPLDQRYQSAAQMRADIDRALAGREVVAPAVTSPTLATEHHLPPVALADPEPTAVASVGSSSEDVSPPKRRIGLLLGLLLLATLVAGALLFGPTLLAGDQVAQTDVPRLLNLTVDQAQKKLEGAQLKLGDREPDFSTSVPAGLVMRQSVAPGERVDEGTAIELIVSAGARERTVPPVTELNISEATALLEESGFKVDPREEQGSSERQGEVISTDPVAGTSMPVGNPVTVYYSAGFIAVPSVVGETEAIATSILEAEGFQVVPSDVRSEATAGTVVKQDPTAGKKIASGNPVVISVSLGPPQTVEPTETASSTEEPPSESEPSSSSSVEPTETESSSVEPTATESSPTQSTSSVPTESTPTEPTDSTATVPTTEPTKTTKPPKP
ncbi:MAG: Stk1 family PASTA domain-containing Ser/Thr kinase [Nocardioidaceae bacterium]